MLTEILVPLGQTTRFSLVAVVAGKEQDLDLDLTIRPDTLGGNPVTQGTKKGPGEYEAPAEPAVWRSGSKPPTFTNLTGVGLTVESVNALAFEGQTVQLYLTVGGEKVDPARGLVAWSLVGTHDGTPPTGKLPSIDARTGELKGGGAGSGARIHAELTAAFLVVWPDGWPRFLSDEGANSWADADGQRVLQIFHGVFRKLPDAYRAAVKDVTAHRNAVDKNYYFPFFVTLGEGREVKKEDLFDPNTGTARVASVIVHEFGHAVMGERCKETFFLLIGDVIAALTTVVTATATVAALGGLVAIPLSPVIALFAVDEGLANLAFKEDLTSAWSKATSWVMDDFRWHLLPLIGWFIGAFNTQPPNYVLSAMAGADRIKGLFGIRNEELLRAGLDWWQMKTGFCSLYATSNPQEDFADSMASYFLDGEWISSHYAAAQGVFRKVEPGKPRFDFIEKYFTDGKSWYDAATGKWNDIKEEEAWRYRGLRFDYRNLAQRPAPTAKATGEVSAEDVQARRETQVHQLKELFDTYAGLGGDELPGLFERNRALLRELKMDPSRQELVVFLRTLEKYGEGLSLAADRQGMQPGDLLVARDRQLLMLARTDEQGRPKVLAGNVRITRDTRPGDLQVDPADLLFHWAPSTAPRRFIRSDQQVSPAYRDLEATLRQLLDLWGESSSPRSGRALDTPLGFFTEHLELAGLRDAGHEFIGDDLTATLNYLRTHGRGLELFEAGRTPLAPGDVVVPYHGCTVGVVTHVSADGARTDVLFGGRWKPGLAGESERQVQHHKKIDLTGLRYLWRPSLEPKTWTR